MAGALIIKAGVEITQSLKGVGVVIYTHCLGHVILPFVHEYLDDFAAQALYQEFYLFICQLHNLFKYERARSVAMIEFHANRPPLRLLLSFTIQKQR